MRADHAGEHHEQRPLGRHTPRHADNARQHARHTHDGNFVVAPKRIRTLETDDEIERLVGHQRERMGRIQPDRDQQRPHLALKILLYPAALLGCALAVRDDANALRRKRRHERIVVQRVLACHQILRLGHERRERGHGVGPLGLATLRRRDVRRGAHLEEFIQVGRDDAQVAQALKQWHIAAASPVEYTLVESQDAVVAVEKRLGRGRQCGFRSGRCTVGRRGRWRGNGRHECDFGERQHQYHRHQ